MYELFMNPDMFLSEDGSYRPLCPVEDEFVAGEIVNRWFHREQARHLKDLHESEMVEFDAVLAELLFRMKQKLSRPQWPVESLVAAAKNSTFDCRPACRAVRGVSWSH